MALRPAALARVVAVQNQRLAAVRGVEVVGRKVLVVVCVAKRLGCGCCTGGKHAVCIQHPRNCVVRPPGFVASEESHMSEARNVADH
jgi:hypothetical protein